MFWHILSGIAAAAGRPGTGRKPTRFSFRFLALLIIAYWLLLAIWIFARPESRAGLVSPESTCSRGTPRSCPACIRHLLPVRERLPE